jgi:hypothetical protein
MMEERDRLLESLFDAADEDLPQEVFASSVIEDIRAYRRRILLGRLSVAALLVMFELLLDSPLQNSLGIIGDVLSTTLYPIKHEWLAFLPAPVNSIAGLIGLILLGIHYFYRKIAY